MSALRLSGVTIWRQIAEELEDEIASRTYAPGGRLPTEMELSARFGVNRHTVRRAIATLEDRGLVRVERGRGTFVQTDTIDYVVGRRTRFSENLRRQQRTPSGTLLRAAEVSAAKAVARGLGIRTGSRVVLLETLGRADGHPISIGAHYFPARRFPGLIRAYEDEGSVSAALEAFGVADYARKLTRITSRRPDPFEMLHLQLSGSQPVLVAESLNTDLAGAPIEVGISRFAADRVQLVVEY